MSGETTFQRTILTALVVLMAPIASAQVIEEPLGYEAGVTLDGMNIYPIIVRSGPQWLSQFGGSGLNVLKPPSQQLVLVQINGELEPYYLRDHKLLATSPLMSLDGATTEPALAFVDEEVTVAWEVSPSVFVCPTEPFFYEEQGVVVSENYIRTDYLTLNGIGYGVDTGPNRLVTRTECEAAAGGTVSTFNGIIDILSVFPLSSPGAPAELELLPIGPYSYLPEPGMALGMAVGVMMLATLR